MQHNKHRKNLRKHKGTYIAPLHKVPNGKTCRHTGTQGNGQSGKGHDTGLFFTKTCDAFQTLACSRNEVVFDRRDLIEVFK